MNFADVAIFVAAADAGSLAAAARRRGISPLTASRRVAALEQAVGARLLHRTTRALALTNEGERFLPFARAMLEAEAGGRAILGEGAAQASGLLRLTASVAFGRKVVTPAIVDFLRQHPEVEADLVLTDALVDLVAQGFDLGIRIAQLRDSSLIARRLADNPRSLYASPDYLRRAGTPTTLGDLASHQCLPLGDTTHWSFRLGDRLVRQRVGGRLSTHSIDALHQACVDGAGIALLSDWDTHDDVAQGRLLPVTVERAVPDALAVWAVYPTVRLVPPRVRLFVEYLSHRLIGD